jgi:ABC transporter substrate binding protein
MRGRREPRGQPHFVLPPNLYVAPGRGDFSISNFHPGLIPGNLAKTIFGVREVAGAEGGGLFWATSLEKIIGGVTAIVSFRQEDGCSSLPCRGVLSFRSEAREDGAVKRREFITLLGSAAAACPLAARAQQRAMPIIGYLSSRSPSDSAHIIAAFHKGLGEAGFTEGRNVAMESRFAESQLDRLPALAVDLVHRQVDVVVATGGTSSVVAAKPVVPPTMPIVFAMGGDPVKLGIVNSLARPGGKRFWSTASRQSTCNCWWSLRPRRWSSAFS